MCIRRSPGIEDLGILMEEAGFSDPDGLEDLVPERWPAEGSGRQRRRGCLTLDAIGAEGLGLHAEHPYVKQDTLIRVALEGRVPGWYAVEKIENLVGIRTEGGAHIFLREKFDSEVKMRGVDVRVWVEDRGVVVDRAEAQAEELVLITENLELGDLEDLI